MQRIALILALIQLAFAVFSFIDVLLTDRSQVKWLPKLVWLFAVVLLSPVSGIIWFAVGKDRTEESAAPRRRAVYRHPDDDPAFSRSSDSSKMIGGESIDERIARLERELAELDDEQPDGSSGTTA
jgi:hypothetical protein